MANAIAVAVPDTTEELQTGLTPDAWDEDRMNYLEDVGGEELLVAIQEHTTELVVPLYNHHSAKPVADKAKRSWNDSVLAIVKWALRAGVALNTVYDTISETLATRVAAIGRDADDPLGAEQLIALRALVENTVSQLNGPFYRMAQIVRLETAVNLLATIGENDATVGKLNSFAKEKIDNLAFHDSRGAIVCSYTPKGSDKEISFTVAQAAKSRAKYLDLVAKAKGVKEANGRQWSAVQRKYRADNPAGMLDRRTKAEQHKIFTAVGAHVMAQGSITAEELAIITESK